MAFERVVLVMAIVVAVLVVAAFDFFVSRVLRAMLAQLPVGNMLVDRFS